MDFFSKDPAMSQPKETIRSSIFGRRRTFVDLNRMEIMFLTIGFVSLIACSGLTLERLVHHSPAICERVYPNRSLANDTANSQNQTDINQISKDSQKCQALFTLALLILINCSFCLFHVFHGVFWERPYELHTFIALIGLATCYCVADLAVGLNKGLDSHTLKFRIKLTRLVILLTAGLVDAILAYKIAWDFLLAGRFACNLMQTYDEIIQKKCKIHFFTQSLIGLDLEFQVTWFVLLLSMNRKLRDSNVELGIVIGVIIFTVIWIVLAHISIRLEKRRFMWFVLASSILIPAYIIYRIVCTAKTSKNLDDKIHITGVGLHYAVFVVGSLVLLIRAVLVGAIFKTRKSYGEDLKDKIYGSSFTFATLRAQTTDLDDEEWQDHATT